MMKTCLYLVLVLLAWGCGTNTRKKAEPKDLVFICTITEPENEPFTIEIDGKEQAYNVPANGVVEIKIPRITPQYSGIMYGRKFYPLYLCGGDTMKMSFSGNIDNWKRSFAGGCKEINEYLSSSIATFENSSFSQGEEVIKEETEKVIQKNIRNLEGKKLPADFVEIEKERLRYTAYASWHTYRMNHRWMAGDANFEPSEVYYSTMHEMARERPELVHLGVYMRFVRRAIETIATRGTEELTPGQVIDNEVKYIRENYKDSTMLAELMHQFIYDYVSRHGVGEKKELVDNYKQYVHDGKRLQEFDQVCATWGKLKPGDPSPSFDFVNEKGKRVTLESLRGKYVYIDLWASWCAPCRREIPYLKKLEHAFAGKDITFVSISCDREVEAWRKAMKEEKVSGIQLYAGDDLTFAKAYVVTGIPRFILLDKEGRIVDANMTQPSDPETGKRLQALLQTEG